MEIEMDKLMKNVTITVEVKKSKKFRFRMWLGLRIMEFATWVIGCRIKVDYTP